MEKRNIFISFSFSGANQIKEIIAKSLKDKGLSVDYSEKIDRSDSSDQWIWDNLQKRIKGSSTTIVVMTPDLITESKGEAGNGFMNSGWVYKEISASLRDWENNRINAVIGVVPDEFYDEMTSQNYCNICNENHTSYESSKINRIINLNRFNVKNNFKTSTCAYDKMKDSYISIVKLSDFLSAPKFYLDHSFDKRERQIKNQEFNITYDIHN